MSGPSANQATPIPGLLESWRFGALAATIAASSAIAFIAILLVPQEGTALSEFAKGFLIRCRIIDPATGAWQLGNSVMFLSGPVIILGVVALVWGSDLRRVAHARPSALLPWVGGGVGVFAPCLAALVFLTKPMGPADYEFPAEGLRTAIPAHPFVLVDHEGKEASLEEVRQGKVVLLTSIYSCCPDVCPRVMAQAKAAVQALTEAESAQVAVLAISLDPARDRPEVLGHAATAYGVSTPQYRLLTGDPAEVSRVLDLYGFDRETDPKTGRISHPPMLVLIDRQGRIAYRFSLGEIQQRWMVEGLRALLAEERP